MFNGKVQLYYLTNGLKSFASLVPGLDADSFLTVVANLLSDVLEVKSNGFLSCENIDVSFEHIYVDTTTYKVSLIYLPLSKQLHDDNVTFENELRTGLVKMIASEPMLTSVGVMHLSDDLSNGTLTLGDICAHIRGEKSFDGRYATNLTTAGSGSLRLIAMNAPERVVIKINRDEFTIGKKSELCDGVISFNRMISRTHCKILRRGSAYSIMDLQSANGTFVNNVRLKQNQIFPIRNGDVIRLANSDFQVIIG